MTKKRESVRTCVGCRQRSPTQVLMRVHLHGDTLVIDGADPDLRTGGRGAWLCRDTESACLQAADRSNAFDRAYRRRVPAGAVAAFAARSDTATPD